MGFFDRIKESLTRTKQQFVERFESIELAGPVELLHASSVGGPKHIPVRYKIRPARGPQRRPAGC